MCEKPTKNVCNKTMSLPVSSKLLLLGHILGEMTSRHFVAAASSPGILAHPPSEPARHHGHKTIWGGFVIGILTVLLSALSYYLFRRRLLPALRKKSRRKVKGECAIFVSGLCARLCWEGNQNLTFFLF